MITDKTYLVNINPNIFRFNEDNIHNVTLNIVSYLIKKAQEINIYFLGNYSILFYITNLTYN